LGYIGDAGAFGWVRTTDFDRAVVDDGAAVVDVENPMASSASPS
jgi:hypothetical protein